MDKFGIKNLRKLTFDQIIKIGRLISNKKVIDNIDFYDISIV